MAARSPLAAAQLRRLGRLLAELEANLPAALAAYRLGRHGDVDGLARLLLPLRQLAAFTEPIKNEHAAARILASSAFPGLLQLLAYAAQSAIAAGFPTTELPATGGAPRPGGSSSSGAPRRSGRAAAAAAADYVDRLEREAVHLRALEAATQVVGMCLLTASGCGDGATAAPPLAPAQDAVATRGAAALLRMRALRWPGALAARALEALEAFQAASPPPAWAAAADASSDGAGSGDSVQLPPAAVAAAHAEMAIRAFTNNYMYRACLMASGLSEMAIQHGYLERSSSSGSGSSSSRSSSGRQQTRHRPRDDLPTLLLAEAAGSGFFEQAARLVLRQAEGLGRRRLLQPHLMAHVEAHKRSGYCHCHQTEAAAAAGGSESHATDLRAVLISNLCRSAQGLHAQQRRRHYSKSNGGDLITAATSRVADGGGSGSGGGRVVGAVGASGPPPVPPPPPLWADCMHVLTLAEAVAGLAAAGFGGGVRGTWGLPPELVAGLPVLGLDARGMDIELGPLLKQLSQQQQHPQQHGGDVDGGGGTVRVLGLSDQPFRLLAAVVDEQLLMASERLLGVGAAAEVLADTCGAAEAALQGMRMAARPCGGRVVGGGSNGGGGCSSNDGGCGSSGLQQELRAWRLPVGRRALAMLCLRVADLAAAGHGAANGAAAHVSNRNRVVLLRLRPHHLWRVGTRALVQARHLLLLPPGIDGRRRKLQPQQPAEERAAGSAAGGGAATAAGRPAAAAAAAATSVGGSGSGSSSGVGSGSGGYPLLPAAWWRSLAALLHVHVPLRVAAASDDEPGSWVYHGDGSTSDASPNARGPAAGGEAAPAGQAHVWLADALRLEGMPDIVLPLQLPPGLAVALRAGLVPAVEAALRRADGTGAAAALADALLQSGWLARDGISCSWPLLQQLLAFAPPAASAALVTSLGKRLQLALDQAEEAAAVAAAVGGGGSIRYAVLTTPVLMLARQLATAPPVMVIVDLDVGCFLSNGAELESRVEAAMASTSMDRVHELTSAERRRQEAAGSPTAAARRQRWAQVRLLLSHALHRWLPPLARFVQQLPGAELSRLVSMEQQWCSRPAGNKFTGFPGLHVAYDCVARALVWIRPPLTALAAAEAVAAARAHALSAARIADGDGSAGSGGSRSSSSSSGAVAAREAELAAATAELASWRQLLFAEVDVVAVIGAGIRMVLQLCSRALHTPLPGLAATTRGDADGGGGGIAGADVPAVCSLVTLLQDALRTACQAAPTEMAAVLLAAAADAAAGPEAAAASAAASPWNPRMLQQLAYADWARQPGMFSSEDVAGGMEAANRHNVEGLREFARAHGVAAARAGFDGGPAARYCRIAGEAVPGLDRWTPVSPLAVRQGAPAAARPAVAAAGSGSSHPSGAAAASPGWGPAAELLPPLRCCANPRCTNLAAAVGADSDADLPLHSCSGCRGAAEYCSKGCQTAHWRAGHREACAALRDR